MIRVASHSFTGGFAGIGKLPALFGWYIRYGIGIKVSLLDSVLVNRKYFISQSILGIF